MMKQSALAACAAISFALPAQADWIKDMTSERCSDRSRTRVAASVRDQIEFSVRRSEAAIAPPAPVGDLGCLEGLMSLPIDTFAPSGGLGSLFSGSLDGILKGDGSQARQFCGFARKKWMEATRGLATATKGDSTFVLPDFASSFDLVNFPAKALAAARKDASPSVSAGNPAPAETQGAAADGTSGTLVDEIWNSLYGVEDER